MSVMFPLIPLYLAMYLLYWRRVTTLSLYEPQHYLGVATILVFSVRWYGAMVEKVEAVENILTEILAIIAAFCLFQQLRLQRNDAEDEIKIARSRLPVAPGLALPFFQVIEGIIEGSSHSDSER